MLVLISVNGAMCNRGYMDYLPVLGEYQSYSGYTDNLAYAKELDHIVNFRVSKLKAAVVDITRDLYDARNYDLHSFSQEVNVRFNDFVNKMFANYSIITSMGYHFEIILFEYKRGTMKLTKKYIPQGEVYFNDAATRAMVYFTVKRLDKLFTEIMDLVESLNNEWEKLKVYVTRGVSEMDHQSTTVNKTIPV